jgi:hypothetical protein
MQVYGWQALVRAKFSLGPPRQTTLLDTSGGRGEGGEGGGGGGPRETCPAGLTCSWPAAGPTTQFNISLSE